MPTKPKHETALEALLSSSDENIRLKAAVALSNISARRDKRKKKSKPVSAREHALAAVLEAERKA